MHASSVWAISHLCAAQAAAPVCQPCAGAPFWGHVVSKDLAHWTWLPPALLPDTQYDFNGVWSGAATMADGDMPILTFTGTASDSTRQQGTWLCHQRFSSSSSSHNNSMRQQREQHVPARQEDGGQAVSAP